MIATIGQIPGLGSVPATGSLFGGSGSGRSNTTSGFGPAFVFGGGSSPDFLRGLYSSLGALTGGTRSTITSAAFDQKRLEGLRSAAAKIDAGDSAGGRAEVQALLQRNARDPAALALVARSYLDERDYKQAQQFYSRAAALLPGNARLQNDLENSRILEEDDTEVIRRARQKLEAPTTRTEGLRLLFLLTDRSPENAEAYLALADGFTAAQRPLQVLGALQEAVALADEHNIDRVIVRAEAFVERRSRIGLGHNILGRALQKAGRDDEALRELKQAADIAPDNFAYSGDVAKAYVRRAASQLERNNLTGASADLDTALSIDPTVPGRRDLLIRLAALRAERDINAGRYNSAVKELARAASSPPDDKVFKERLAANFNRVARYYEQNGDDNLALSHYLRAYELDPNSTLARRKTAELSHEAGLDFRDKSIHVTAIDHLERAYRIEPTNDTYRRDLALAYDLRGLELQTLGALDITPDRLDEAIENFNEAFRLDPTNAAIGSHLSAAIIQRDAA